jgi:hypothetical protein
LEQYNLDNGFRLRVEREILALLVTQRWQRVKATIPFILDKRKMTGQRAIRFQHQLENSNPTGHKRHPFSSK